jgi:hypothetical protein
VGRRVVGLVIGLGGGDSLCGRCIYCTSREATLHGATVQPGRSTARSRDQQRVPARCPAIWNFYTEPIRQISLIHNLEHGGIVVQYGSEVPPETVEQIRGWWQGNPDGLVVAPLPALGNQVALTAWTQLLSCPGYSQEAFDAFRVQYLGQGPEPLSISLLVTIGILPGWRAQTRGPKSSLGVWFDSPPSLPRRSALHW